MNPSAFPIPNDDRPGAYPAEPGMSFRDYCAAKFMAMFLRGAALPPGFDAREQLAFTADRAYEAADAMLAARLK